MIRSLFVFLVLCGILVPIAGCAKEEDSAPNPGVVAPPSEKAERADK